MQNLFIEHQSIFSMKLCFNIYECDSPVSAVVISWKSNLQETEFFEKSLQLTLLNFFV